MEVLKQPLSNVQLELLKTFSHQLSESEILDLRKVLAQFFAQRAIQIANEVWEEKGWGDEDVERMLDTKMRKKTN
jgi:F0F1-type ATP synthase delta subunit